MLEGVLKLFKPQPIEFVPQIFRVSEKSIEFKLKNGGIVVVSKQDMFNSPYVQNYALERTNVIDIREVKNEEKMFEIYLSTGIHYTLRIP